MTTPQTFRKPDVARALSAVTQAGLKVLSVRFPPEGGFTIVTNATEEDDDYNEWDEILDEA